MAKRKTVAQSIKNPEKLIRILKDFHGEDIISAVVSRCKNARELKKTLTWWENHMKKRMEIQKESLDNHLRDVDAEMKTMARPPVNFKNFSDREFRFLVMIQCTINEIAAFYQVGERTLRNMVNKLYGMEFEALAKLLSPGIKVGLRRSQWRNALGGNAQMQIFLGKNYLGQSDRVDLTTKDQSLNWSDLVAQFEDGDEPEPSEIRPKKPENMD